MSLEGLAAAPRQASSKEVRRDGLKQRMYSYLIFKKARGFIDGSAKFCLGETRDDIGAVSATPRPAPACAVAEWRELKSGELMKTLCNLVSED